MNNIYPRVTPDRLRYMRDLIAMGVGEPYVRGTTRNHLLRLGWIDGVLELPDGRQFTHADLDKEFGKGSEEWQSARFAGVTMTDAGKEAIQQTPGA